MCYSLASRLGALLLASNLGQTPLNLPDSRGGTTESCHQLNRPLITPAPKFPLAKRAVNSFIGYVSNGSGYLVQNCIAGEFWNAFTGFGGCCSATACIGAWNTCLNPSILSGADGAKLATCSSGLVCATDYYLPSPGGVTTPWIACGVRGETIFAVTAPSTSSSPVTSPSSSGPSPVVVQPQTVTQITTLSSVTNTVVTNINTQNTATTLNVVVTNTQTSIVGTTTGTGSGSTSRSTSTSTSSPTPSPTPPCTSDCKPSNKGAIIGGVVGGVGGIAVVALLGLSILYTLFTTETQQNPTPAPEPILMLASYANSPMQQIPPNPGFASAGPGYFQGPGNYGGGGGGGGVGAAPVAGAAAAYDHHRHTSAELSAAGTGLAYENNRHTPSESSTAGSGAAFENSRHTPSELSATSMSPLYEFAAPPSPRGAGYNSHGQYAPMSNQHHELSGNSMSPVYEAGAQPFQSSMQPQRVSGSGFQLGRADAGSNPLKMSSVSDGPSDGRTW